MNGEKQKKEMAENPSRDDVHEQRSPDQAQPGVVTKKDPPAPRPPTTTESDRERADWEGMGQPQSKPGS